MHIKFWLRTPRGRDFLVDLRVVEEMISKCILDKCFGRELDSSGSGWGAVAEFSEHGNKPSGSIKGGEFVDHLSDYQFLKKDSVQLVSCV